MSNFKRLKSYNHLLLLFGWPLILLYFVYCEKVITAPKYVMHCRVDDFIPFVNWFIIPYEMWYFYLAAGFLYLGFASRKDFINLCFFLYLGHFITCTLYLTFPNGQHLRPNLLGTDILSQMIKNLYRIDTPQNVIPSLHVFDSISICVCMGSYFLKSNKTILNLVSILIALAASISTLFIKQHSILDVLAGIALAAVIYIPSMKLSDLFQQTNSINRTNISL